MADIVTEITVLGNLGLRAHRLALAAESLGAAFEQESARLNREEEASLLEAMHSAAVQGLERAEDMEHASRTGHNMAGTAFTALRVIAGLFTGLSEDLRLQTISRRLLDEPEDRRTPFGTVMVRVGPGGLPGDVSIAIVSSMAREEGMSEPEVMEALAAQGNLLFSAEAFRQLVESVGSQILKGELSLPISAQRLRELKLHSAAPRVLPSPALPSPRPLPPGQTYP